MKIGKVYLVGAGPGDPGLMTVRGLDLLRKADVVVYDRLVNPVILEEAAPEAILIFAGKRSSYHALPQEEINELLIAHARRGRLVVRLKGGDPFVFGRGGEEAEALRAAGVPFEVVPGVSSAIAVPAYAGIPLTHRKLSSSFAVITGHEACKPKSSVDWALLANSVDTLVVLMGLNTLPAIAAKLVRHGRAPETPVALIRSGTTAKQEVIIGTLADIGAHCAKLAPPVLAVIGEVVKLSAYLEWFSEAYRSGELVRRALRPGSAGALEPQSVQKT
ncbi:MAG TPA: uroporphyrinogen-III C-methyltransferase [Candidatus Acidoferrales bacterium]|nr:uroporphyrinogen-III C-methyltransferase [Candidatus Acidoferrales bacterium]